MNETPSVPGPQPLEWKRGLDAVCDRFEAAWQTGQRPRLEDWLAEAPAPLRAPLLRELVLLDARSRRLGGETPLAADYAARFPQLPAAWLQEAFGERIPGQPAADAHSTPAPPEPAAARKTPSAGTCLGD
jgi:hypothetical protein